VLTENQMLRSIAWYDGDSAPEDQYDEYPVDADLPGAVVARTGEPLFIRSLAQLRERYPGLPSYYPTDCSLHVGPLTIGGNVLGVLTLTFLGGEVADDAQPSYVQAMADVLAQALERALASDRADEERGRDLHLVSAQLDVLAGIVAGRPLPDALDSLLLAVEAVWPGMHASVLLLDEDGLLRHCSAPTLPRSYVEAIDGLAVGPTAGSCGTAAHRRRQVIVEDVMVDPLWEEFRDLAAAANLRSCSSAPIIGATGRLLGSFALYHPEPHRPSPRDLALVEVLVRTVTMAVERSRVDEERDRELAAERTAALTLQHSLLPATTCRPPR
jgi:GAF domain-containing protein